jgi:septal ring factor EnvC (AmiA/AmiB activator)
MDGALDALLPYNKIKDQSPDKSIDTLNTFLYSFLSNKFPPPGKNKIPAKKDKFQKRFQRQLKKLRKMKAANSKARRALFRAGLSGSTEAKLLSKQFKRIIRKLNRLRKKIKRARDRHAQRLFRKNPLKYTKGLFAGQTNNGTPVFGKDAAQQYFTDTYEDGNRDHKFSPPPGVRTPSGAKIRFPK